MGNMSATTETKSQPGPFGFAKMAGSSIAGRDAAPWVTDFLNAAYYRRDVAERDVDDLRFAFGVLTTYWYRSHPDRRLRVTDLPAFHRAFGGERFGTEESARGTLSREALERGASKLIGDWFPEAYADDARRAWGMAFPTVEERDAYDPERRLKLAKLGELTAESAPLEQQVWHTYPPVEMPSAEAVIGAVTRPETWPDYASEIGRFTPLRPGGLAGQTFEIEVAANTRGRAARLHPRLRDDHDARDARRPEGPARLVRGARGRPGPLRRGRAARGPRGRRAARRLRPHDPQRALHGQRATTACCSTRYEGKTWLKAAGTWDPMPWHLDKAYSAAGHEAQHAFWGQRDDEALSMLHQLAKQIAK